MNYFSQLRQDWIDEMLSIYGYVGPQHLKIKFGISTAQCSKDFKSLRERNGGVFYCVSDKVYKVSPL